MADIQNLIDQLDSLVSQNSAVTGTIENLGQLRDLVNQISSQGTAGLSTAQQSKLRTAQAIIKSTAGSVAGYSKSAASAAASNNNLTSTVTKLAGGAGLAALGIGALGLADSLDKTAFKALGVQNAFNKLGIGTATSFQEAFIGMYDQGVVPILNQAEESFGTIFGELQVKSADATQNLGFDLRNAADDTAALADKLGRGLGAATNSLRFFAGGLEGRIQVTKDFGESISSLMPVLFIMGEKLDQTSLRQIATFKNALNLSGEELEAIGRRASGFGTDVSTELMKVERTALALANATGIEKKVIGSALTDLRADFMTFGDVSTAELGKVAARAISLGVDISKLKGIATTFDDFEKSADSVAVLSQALGVNIDAFKLFETEDPTERLMMIRDAFAEAGQDITQMNRRQRTLLQNLGIDPEVMLPSLGTQTGAGAERAASIREGAAGLDMSALEASFNEFNLKNAASAEKYFEQVASLTTRNVEGIQKQFQNAAQNLVLSKENRAALTESFGSISKIPDLANDAFSGISLQTGKVSKEAIDAIQSTQNKFNTMFRDGVKSAVKTGLESSTKAVNTLVGEEVISAEDLTVKPPAKATTVSPATKQPQTVDTQRQTQQPPQEIAITMPVVLQLDGVELGTGIANAKLPGGLLGQQLDNLNLKIPGQISPNTSNL